MRIITGSARGARLTTPEGEHTRPTSERAKEALFSSLGYSISGGTVLDLFAGSGQLGLEAASRGARSVVLVDNDASAVAAIQANVKKCRLEDRCTVVRSESLAYLDRCSGDGFDLVLLDPPYATALIDMALTRLLDRGLLTPHSIVVCESDREDILSEKNAERLETVRVMKHGVARISILRVKEIQINEDSNSTRKL